MAVPVDKIIPAYPYVQYSDDPNVVSFFTAYNAIAQQYLTAFNTLDLPYWPSSNINSHLLDWIALGIYGERRPYVKITESKVSQGAYNTIEYNAIPYAELKKFDPGKTQHLPDEYFKRILKWNFYKADGFQFSITWLKRRLARFIHGRGGLAVELQNTFDISVACSKGSFDINVIDYGDGVGNFLKIAIEQGLVNLPFIYSFNVTVNK